MATHQIDCLIPNSEYSGPELPLGCSYKLLGKKLASQYESEKVEKLLGQNGLKGLQMVQFECPRHPKPNAPFFSEVG